MERVSKLFPGYDCRKQQDQPESFWLALEARLP